MVSYEKLTKAGIDMDELLKRLMGNAALVKVFVGKFIADRNFELLKEAFAKADAEQAEHASHTLKGMCGNMSLSKLYALFTEQVNLIRMGEIARAEAMMPELSLIFGNAINNMQQWLSEN